MSSHQVPEFFLIFIIVSYIVIAAQFYFELRKIKGARRAKSALTAILFIFLLCAMSGYVPALFDIPDVVHTGTHVLLSIAAFTYIVLNGAKTIAIGLKQDEQS